MITYEGVKYRHLRPGRTAVEIAASLREATGSDSDIIVYGAVAVYVGRKLEKIVSVWKGAKDN